MVDNGLLILVNRYYLGKGYFRNLGVGMIWGVVIPLVLFDSRYVGGSYLSNYTGLVFKEGKWRIHAAAISNLLFASCCLWCIDSDFMQPWYLSSLICSVLYCVLPLLLFISGVLFCFVISLGFWSFGICSFLLPFHHRRLLMITIWSPMTQYSFFIHFQVQNQQALRIVEIPMIPVSD